MKSRFREAAIVVAIGVALSACARPSGPVEIPQEEFPFSVARATAPSPSPSPEETLTVFFVRAGRLAPATRAVSGDLRPVEAAARALLEGPTAEERLGGMDSIVPPQTSLLEIHVLEQVADIDLSAEFQSPAEPELIHLRIAQVVWTLVDLPEINAVRFFIDGALISVATDGGVPVDRPVTARDFESVAPLLP